MQPSAETNFSRRRWTEKAPSSAAPTTRPDGATARALHRLISTSHLNHAQHAPDTHETCTQPSSSTERTWTLRHHSCTCACSTTSARCVRGTVQTACELRYVSLRPVAGWSHWWPCSCWSLRTPSTPRWLQVAERLPRYARRSFAQPSIPAASHTPSQDSSRSCLTSAVVCALTEDDHMVSIHHGVHAAMLESLTNEVAARVCRQLP